MSHRPLETEHFAEFSFWHFYYRVRVCCFLLTISVTARSNVSVSILVLLVVLVPSHHSSFFFCPVLPLFSANFLSSGHVHVFSINYMFFPHFSSLLKHKLSFTRANSVNVWVLLNHSLISSPQTSLEQSFPTAHQHIMTAKEATWMETNCNSTCPVWHQTHVMSFHDHKTYYDHKCYFVLIFPSHWYWTSSFTKNGYLMVAV